MAELIGAIFHADGRRTCFVQPDHTKTKSYRKAAEDVRVPINDLEQSFLQGFPACHVSTLERGMKTIARTWLIIGIAGVGLAARTTIASPATSPASDSGFRAVAAGNRIRVAVGPTNRIRLTADDGPWRDQEVPACSSLFDIAYGDEGFVAVGTAGVV